MEIYPRDDQMLIHVVYGTCIIHDCMFKKNKSNEFIGEKYHAFSYSEYFRLQYLGNGKNFELLNRERLVLETLL